MSRRDRHGDDVDGVSGRAGSADVERTEPDDWRIPPTPKCLPARDAETTSKGKNHGAFLPQFNGTLTFTLPP